ncbi:MAG: hypothetical protein PHR68_01825 [Candidatus Gracilibacteria bacterium]|nr:hypothetical protein [Candidatus Gracilibacteria bacterium]
MQEIIDFFKNTLIQDYILFFVSIFLVAVFFALGINKLYKAIFGVLIGFFLFLMLNLGFHFLNTNANLYMLNGLREYLQNNKNFILVLSFFSIPVFPIMMMFNKSVDFHSRSSKYIKYVKIFIGSFFLAPLILNILDSIAKNKLLFGIDYTLVEKINSFSFFKSFLEYFSISIIYQNIDRYGYILLIILLIYIFYELIFSGLFSFIFHISKKIFINIAEKIKKDMKKGGGSHQDDEEEDYEDEGHDSHHH